MGVYREVLGEDYSKLSGNLQRLHDQPFSTSGHIEVTGKWMARLFGLPASGDYGLVMDVSSEGDVEIWRRHFLGDERWWSKTTRQWRDGDFLKERIGPMVVTFRLNSFHGFLSFEPISSRLFGVPLPRFCALEIWALELDSEEYFAPLVSFHHPWFGHLCTYAGRIRYPWKSPSGSS